VKTFHVVDLGYCKGSLVQIVSAPQYGAPQQHEDQLQRFDHR
jgi:hypothetical protein